MMNDRPTIETAELGHTFLDSELKDQCKVIVGGIAWPGKQPGFGVILALDAQKYYEGGHIILLDEVESFRLGELIRKCEGLNLKYRPKFWSGDNKNAAAGKFMLDSQSNSPFWVSHSSILDLEQPYSYTLTIIQDLLRDGSRRLFLKSSTISGHLGTIKQEDVASLQVGDLPAIEALAFAVCELKDDSLWWPKPPPRQDKPGHSYPMGF